MSTRFDMIGIFVADLPKMVAFYRDALGLAIDWDGQGPYAEFKHEGIRLSMFERKELPKLLGQTPEFPRGLNGSFELAINVGQPENVDVRFREVIASGGGEVYWPPRGPGKMG